VCKRWVVDYQPDRFNSTWDVLRILDDRDQDHPQGPLVLAQVNVMPFAPHVHHALANAALMAAAPDLLAALEAALEAVEYYDEREGAGCLLDQARAAIAKAKAQIEY
jgi:hypothetical protein